MFLHIMQDYEYASYNPIAYDIANHFCEMVADYHSDTPHVLDYSKYPGTVILNSILRRLRLLSLLNKYIHDTN